MLMLSNDGHDRPRDDTLLLREHLLVAESFVVALKLDVHSVS